MTDSQQVAITKLAAKPGLDPGELLTLAQDATGKELLQLGEMLFPDAALLISRLNAA